LLQQVGLQAGHHLGVGEGFLHQASAAGLGDDVNWVSIPEFGWQLVDADVVVGEQLLAHTRFANQQHRRVRSGDGIDLGEDGAHPRALGHDGQQRRRRHVQLDNILAQLPQFSGPDTVFSIG
jgi:hypothetical protein